MNVAWFSGLPKNESVLHPLASVCVRCTVSLLLLCFFMHDNDLQSSSQAYDGTHGIEANVVLGILDCHALGSIDNCCLGCVIPGESAARSDTSCGSSGHERATSALLLKIRHEHTRRVEDGLDVDGKHFVEFLIDDFVGRLSQSKQVSFSSSPRGISLYSIARRTIIDCTDLVPVRPFTRENSKSVSK